MQDKKYWNNDNLEWSNSEEYRYLDDIDNLIAISEVITKKLNRIRNREELNIDDEKEKIKIDFTKIENKLEEVSGLIEDKLKEIKGR